MACEISRGAFLKLTILTLIPHYLPGYKYGGPVRTVASIVERLGADLDFRIITSDRDLSDTTPYPAIPANEWRAVGQAQVFHASPDQLSLRRLAALIRRTPHDVLYLNTYFEPVFTVRPLLARRLGWLDHRPTIVSPQGVFSPGALGFKPRKKSMFLALARRLGLHDGLTWQASSAMEAADIRLAIGPSARIVVSPDFPGSVGAAKSPHQPRAPGDPFRVVFVSRIARKKNLDYALQVLSKTASRVQFDIYGPIEDAVYWRECQALMSGLPSRVTVKYHGGVQHDQIAAIFAGADLFLFPTQGENFGHVVIESMLAGTPVLTSDTTPWDELESHGAGWVFPLAEDQRFADTIDGAAALAPAETMARRNRVARYATERSSRPEIIEAKRRLFVDAGRRDILDIPTELIGVTDHSPGETKVPKGDSRMRDPEDGA